MFYPCSKISAPKSFSLTPLEVQTLWPKTKLKVHLYGVSMEIFHFESFFFSFLSWSDSLNPPCCPLILESLRPCGESLHPNSYKEQLMLSTQIHVYTRDPRPPLLPRVMAWSAMGLKLGVFSFWPTMLTKTMQNQCVHLWSSRSIRYFTHVSSSCSDCSRCNDIRT